MNHLPNSLDSLCRYLKLDVGYSVVVDAGKIQGGTFTHQYGMKKYIIVVDKLQYATITRLS